MLIEDVNLLRCVDCYGDLIAVHYEINYNVIVNGVLRCSSCDRNYPIIDEVGMFFRKEHINAYISNWEINKLKELGYSEILKDCNNQNLKAVKEQVAVAKNWQYQHERVYQWEQDIGKDSFHGKRLFWTFIPIKPEIIKQKIVYIACTGRGKEVYHVLNESPRKVIANEIGAEIYSITSILGKYRKDLTLLRFDISYSPLKPEQIDIAICDHALQHVLDHKRAFSKLVESLKINGLISICVYSYENNFLMTHIVEPLKSILKHFPLILIRGLAFLPAFIIYLAIHFIYKPISKLSRKIGRFLPLYDHMIFWSTSSLNFIWSACFDLMHAPISYHFRKAEVENLASSNDVEVLKFVNTHGTTWSLVGKKQKKKGVTS